ncbi:unnamed protein product, partial [Phaeothamnion confervicola]
VSRRSKPNSRTTLIGEQPNPWDLLQPQDVMSRHRGAKLCRRYGLLGKISLLSLEYLLSVERWPFHAEPPDHYGRLSSLLDLSVSQRPPQSNCPPRRVLIPDNGTKLDIRKRKGGISPVPPSELTPQLHRLPPILHIHFLIPLRSYSKGS